MNESPQDLGNIGELQEFQALDEPDDQTPQVIIPSMLMSQFSHFSNQLSPDVSRYKSGGSANQRGSAGVTGSHQNSQASNPSEVV